MGKKPPEFYWDKNHHKYPFQVTVGHMSMQDVDPKIVQQRINFHFIRVPFDGSAHWGFTSQADLDGFKKLAGIAQK